MTELITVPPSLEGEQQLRESTFWRAYHIFYGGNPVVILRDCILPLMEAMQSAGEIVEYFYINYWVEGSHVRLRVSVYPEDIPAVDRHIIDEVSEYLTKYPSYHPMAQLADNDFYENLFQGEFTEQERPLYFHADGAPRFAENNSIEIREYQPEWLRYGGAVGMLISQRQFVESTQLAFRLVQLGNMRVRTILLGISTQLTFITAICLLRDMKLVEDFFLSYHHRWADGYDENPAYGTEEGRRNHVITAQNIRKKILPLAQEILAGNVTDLPRILRDWVASSNRMRALIEDACATHPLEFSYDDGVRHVSDPRDAAWSLCHSYIHMMNNRIMVSVADEAFIAYQIVDAIRGSDDVEKLG